MTRLDRVFIDTSELFPFTIMDFLLTLSEDFLFTWVWTDELLEEWQDAIVREGQRTPESAASMAAAVRNHFVGNRIDPALPPVLAAGVRVITSDEFLCARLSASRHAVLDSFIRGAAARKRPPTTPDEFARKIGAAGAPVFAEELRSHLVRDGRPAG